VLCEEVKQRERDIPHGAATQYEAAAERGRKKEEKVAKHVEAL
jgi:hypothetical protein